MHIQQQTYNSININLQQFSSNKVCCRDIQDKEWKGRGLKQIFVMLHSVALYYKVFMMFCPITLQLGNTMKTTNKEQKQKA